MLRMNRTWIMTLVAIGLVLLPATPAMARVRVGTVVPYHAESPSPYGQGHESMPVVWSDEIRAPGATFVRLHFSEFDLASGDFVAISGPDGEQRRVYTGRGPRERGEFWTFPVQGDRVVVTLHAGGAGGRGYVIDRIGEGFAPDRSEATEIICGGTDGRQDIACYGSQGKQLSRPVARLLFEDGGSFFVCTGWLVRGAAPSTLMTNNHCIDSQAIVDTTVVRFNYQNSACGGVVNDPFFEFDGDQFLKTSTSLDYTLITVAGDPEGLGAGEFIPTTLKPAPGDNIVVPQHPGGTEKVVGVWENVVGGARCRAKSVNQTYLPYQAGSQFNYACDTEGGSSGSPVLNPVNFHAWGIHHLGNVTILQCSNGATQMAEICADAGPLLDCASN